MFQFLIGRMKTAVLHYMSFSLTLFQFLIGRMKTYIFSSNIIYYVFVSIPHR
ncbi:hypothetical protein KsCSTR_13210 [Candidatus Kuenenia stuttgartiensis]|uniref:Uncharacterized protein n=1 Tax=Kuenenia stuttgartiensis TaxID=174633 RepID=Q1Q0Y6_KUEST|nr:hypothetical protein KsCSTR_13210 [Candidatus Kuenenia stuttgartiensis]CAJ73671.1 unknown protein [Candidatus Kuenenia stuttgartiensis]